MCHVTNTYIGEISHLGVRLPMEEPQWKEVNMNPLKLIKPLKLCPMSQTQKGRRSNPSS